MSGDWWLDRMTRLFVRFVLFALAWTAGSGVILAGQQASRFAWLDESDPFSVGRDSARLTTPQWFGEKEVEAVIILAIDDMRDPQKYETYLRPILNRLRQIDGRAPVSILCNALDPAHPQLQKWLKEGVSLEVHTLSHPCPLLARSNFTAAADTFHGCVDLLNHVPGNQPVAFRMPCCDSINSPSPRFYAEIFNRTNSSGQYLTIDSSVMNVTTSNDKWLPRELVTDAGGRERFRKYIPFPSFVTTIEDHPYPYVIGKLCWEFPAMVPSDWEAQRLHGTNNPVTVADWKAALDTTVIKQGTFTFIFHPHGWIRADQIVEFIDYAVGKYGKKVKFASFHDAQENLDKHLLLGQPLRTGNGQENGVRLLDLNDDGYLDVVIGNERLRKTRLWDAVKRQWTDSGFPTALVASDRNGSRHDGGARFGVVDPDGAILLVRNESVSGAWRFDGRRWREEKSLLKGLDLDADTVLTQSGGRDRGVRFRDVDNDGRCELIVSNDKQNRILSWSAEEKSWMKLPFALPADTPIVDEQGRDNGLRFVDINEDGYADVIFSNKERYAAHLFIAVPKPHLGWDRGWSFKISGGKRGDSGDIPAIVRGGSSPNNGAWFHSKHLWVQNEDTAHLPDHVDRRSFTQLLMGTESPPKSPEESLACIRVRPGFKVEIVASEPMVVDPVAFDWGPDGGLWVAEMRDYPVGMDGKGKAGGAIKHLEDTDGDGRYDKATLFLEGVSFPNGVMPWRKGVLVSAAPEIFYAEDTDGDGKADLRKTLLSGFGEGNQQHRINGFEYGLDNWVYAANGGSNGKIRSALTGGTADLRGHDVRFKPDTGEFELVAGQTQFGRRRDDWGNWFGNENPTWLWHYLFSEHYLARNRELSVRTTRRVLARYSDSTRVYPLSRPQQRFNWPGAVNHLTSANSATPYRDELFGSAFATSVFISEPAHNLVHREILEADGVSFVSHRAPDEQEGEFLASTDNWFRPTMLKIGPDGALYIADMYRLVIEHPEYFPEELKNRPDLRAGDDKGRIYRVYPERVTLRKVPRLDTLDNTGLVLALASTNGWQRDIAQRLIIERGDTNLFQELLKLSESDLDPRARIQFLSTFEALGRLTPGSVSLALSHSHAAVREFAVRLSEPFLRTASSPDAVPSAEPKGNPPQTMKEVLLWLVNDPSIRVRHQLAFSLGEWQDPRAARALVELATKDRDNEHIQLAVLSSMPPHLDSMLGIILADDLNEAPPHELFAQLLAAAVKSGDREIAARAIERLAKPIGEESALWQLSALAGFLDALDRWNKPLEKLQNETDDALKRAIARLEVLFSHARRLAASGSSRQSPDPEFLAAIQLLGRTPNQRADDIGILKRLLQPQMPAAFQERALDQLKKLSDADVADALLESWNRLGPGMRINLASVLLTRPVWIQKLLSAVQSDAIPAGEISPAHQQQLLNHSDGSIRDRANTVFGGRMTDRDTVLKSYANVSELNGNPERGALLYRQSCMSCHRLKGEGNSLGPDLETMSDKPVGALLVAILDPNQAFESRYINYTVTTRNDRELTGIIVAETPNSLTLRNAAGADEIVLRNDIKELTSSRLSLMPEGFEKILKPQNMADLIAYIRAR
jgi:putative membrane-bound dehydrogenase-like protein